MIMIKRFSSALKINSFKYASFPCQRYYSNNFSPVNSNNSSCNEFFPFISFINIYLKISQKDYS